MTKLFCHIILGSTVGFDVLVLPLRKLGAEDGYEVGGEVEGREDGTVVGLEEGTEDG